MVTCASSSELITLHTLAMVSFFLLRFISRTPCVARPITLQVSTASRITIPLLLMIMRSFWSVTFFIATSRPVFSVMFRVFTPLPPRLVLRYTSSSFSSTTAVRLPYPFSLTTITVSFFGSLTTIMPTTASSSPSRRIPRTPVETRPMVRTAFSLKRTARPLRLAMISSL